MKWCVVILALALATLSGCAGTGTGGSWTGTSRSHCLGQANQRDARPGFVIFCAESP